MNQKQLFPESQDEKKRFRHPGLKILTGFISTVLFIVFFFQAAGGFDWTRGWVFICLLTLGQTANTVFIWRRNPELLKHRAEIGEGTKNWDKILLALFGLTYLVTLFVAAFDRRFDWSVMHESLWLAGCALHVFFIVIFTWAMAVNPHFEKTVRIQENRGHKVIASGPYRFVRHPGYTGAILGFILSAPLLLGSWWAFVPAFFSSASLVIRTLLEDQTLRRELPGYENYAHRVRYRLLPRVW